ncbi:MAG TPA: aspartate aminotransferase family protein [Ktedonobacterales bacterium]|jgi:acetylornithine aminotransferase/acetylornithine/N-succinyldiaminopimelate aminotransferase
MATPTKPQTEQRDWFALEKQYYQGTFTRQPVAFVRGEGARVWDADGRSYLDFVAGIAVNILGHCHPAVVNAVCDQAKQLIHVSNLYVNTRQVELAELLYHKSGGMRAFFSNSGAEANEGAIKLARKFGRLHRNGAYEIISMNRSFHGRTLATTSATGQAKYQETWVPLADGFKQVDFNDLDALKAATSAKTVGVLIEPVQGEGGIFPADTGYLQGVRAWCDEQNLVMIADEVQAGMGRTGKFFSWEHYGIQPDIVTMAKGLAGGVPIGAMLAAPRADLFGPGDHGTTFGGNPLASAAGVATIRAIDEFHLVENAAAQGDYLKGRLLALKETYPFITEVRAIGLMNALDVQGDLAPAIVKAALERGLLLNNVGNTTLRMIPPLILSRAEIDEGLGLLDGVLREVSKV